jgi:hypothetical protein
MADGLVAGNGEKWLVSLLWIKAGFPLFRLVRLGDTYGSSPGLSYDAGVYGTGKYPGYRVYLPGVSIGG